MDPPQPGLPEIVYVDDDDDEIVDEWLDTDSQLPALEAAIKVQTQVQLCIALLCLLPILCTMIMLSWRKFGGRIVALQSAHRSIAHDKRS